MKIQSTPITFIDQTDSRKLEVYIKSNLPTVQIQNSNTGAYTPDWREGENLILSMDVFLDSRAMDTAGYNGTAIKWYKNDIEMTDGSIEDISDDRRKITIKDNILKDDAIITYTCEATYQGIVASSRITFARVDSGRNGNDGADGTSVKIKGTASSVAPVSGTDYYTITYSGSGVSSAELNDAYMYSGDLYVCVDSRDGIDYFINVGRIQGPAGDPAKNIILSGSAQVFKVSKTNTYAPATISVTAHTFNTSITNWAYSTNGGQAFLSTAPDGVVRNGNIVTVTGSTLASNSIVVKASDGTVEDVFTIYKAFDGTDGSDGDKGDPAPLAFLTNENISFAANENGQVPLTIFTTNVVAYKGTTKVAPTVRIKADGTPDITDLPAGMTASAPINSSNEQILTFSIANNATLGSSSSNSGTITIPITSPVSTNLRLNWSKINTGRTGVSVKSTTVSYGVSDSSAVQPTSWQATIPTVADGKYLWTRTIIDYTDESIPDTVTYIYAKQGEKGSIGNPGSSVTVSSIQYQEGTSATTAPTGAWSNTVVPVADGRYLWSKTTFSDNKVAYGVAKQGNSGSNFRTFTTEYQAAQDNINDWAEMESTEWDVNESTAGTKVGDTVMIRCYNTTKQGYSYILATVISVPSDKKIHSKSTGLLDKGEPGTGASLVDVTPSAMYFKSTTGSTGAFTPEYIYLYPRFQNSTYSNWQYSRDGGATWAAASGANGLTIGTYNSVANSLRIAKGSTLYTDSITSISFKCNSTTSGIYDTVSIAKIYDVVDLQIGGRNLLPQSKMDKVPTMWGGGNTFTIVTEDGYTCAKLTGSIGVTTSPNIDIFNKLNTLDIAQEYTVSAWVKVVNYVGGTTNPFCALYFSGSKVSDNSWIGATNVFESGDMTRFNNQGWKRLIWTLKFDSPISKMNFYVYVRDLTGTIFVRDLKLEYGNVPTDWSPAPEDLIEEAANVNVMLSNEAHFFEATAGGVPIDTSVTLDVVGYKGSVKSTTTVGTISGIPSAGMTTTVANNNTTNTKLTIAITSALTSDIADYGILTIPITVNGHTINKIFNWTKAKAGDVGASGSDAVTFQVYSNNGYALSTSTPTIMLQTFAYVGDVEIKAGSTYQWYRHNGTDWVAVSGATNDYFNISRDDVVFSNNYMCKMQFNGTEYVGVVTIEDKNDENKVFASKPSNYFAGDLWIVGTDYAPSGYAVGTMLRAEHTNVAYTDNDWVPATKYDDEIKELKDTVDSYKQYFSVNSANGLQIGNASINNDILTIGTINTDIINANSSSFESVDIVGKYSGSTMLQAPVLNLGNFSLAIESNGSLSIVVNT